MDNKIKIKLISFILIFSFLLLTVSYSYGIGIKQGKNWFVANEVGYIFIVNEIDMELFSDVLTAFIYFDGNNIKHVKINVNSYGGDVFPSLGIAQIIFSRSDNMLIETYGIGIVASGATLILMSGTPDHRFLYDNTNLMMHEVGVLGNTMENETIVLNRTFFVEENVENFYLKMLNISKEELSDILDIETWFLPERAIEMGLADKIIGE